jgi:hypothetical protein
VKLVALSTNLISSSISKDFDYDSHTVQTRFDGSPLQLSSDDFPLHTSEEDFNGLQMIIAKEPGTWTADFCIFPTFAVHSPYELPDGFNEFQYCQFDFGKTLDVLITPQVTFTDKSLISVAPSKRNCYFDGERELKFYRIYTKHNCEMECLADHLFQLVNCTPYYLAREHSTNVCDLDKLKHVKRRSNATEVRQCNCLERCNSVKYEFEVQQKWTISNEKELVG